MPDWEHLVAERLAHIELTPEVQREVVAEIAAHLEECYVKLLDAGSSDPEGRRWLRLLTGTPSAETSGERRRTV